MARVVLAVVLMCTLLASVLGSHDGYKYRRGRGAYYKKIDSKGGPKGYYIKGTEGDDNIRGGPGDDRIYGGGGDDYIDGRRGDDYIYGGEGDDTIYGGPGDDVIMEMEATTQSKETGTSHGEEDRGHEEESSGPNSTDTSAAGGR
eukprot:CAMPEP_0198731956 /NCGR_PEP_ID=MMETSP1475-20131203/33033_1 /TAXON_ID= ORGANISM="Unidentified sp., Strain CCMP1999" /NCGR_SAMPLE_ID=MMETSP1475 /ASSEMBLY_ACC=CAM_ASM_001111 /LENGTH=144 /DNA_ID=CAMNT_0044494985 /DNA_START=1 /DNA_END=433 /DNA_ORIENTATION=+